jgi:hypothetical protein
MEIYDIAEYHVTATSEHKANEGHSCMIAIVNHGSQKCHGAVGTRDSIEDGNVMPWVSLPTQCPLL